MGGGAIRPIGETFLQQPFTGTAGLSIPIKVSPCRGSEPQFSVDYTSGGGNGVFGIGWSLSLPSISRKTSRGTPLYNDDDNFILAGAGELVLADDGAMSRTFGDITYQIQRYVPRVEGRFAKIERWAVVESGESFWRVIDRNNVTSVYGASLHSQVCDSRGPDRAFRWLLHETYDDRGNRTLFDYAIDDSDLGTDQLNEAGRDRSTNRYLSRIRYGSARSLTRDEHRTLRAIEYATTPSGKSLEWGAWVAEECARRGLPSVTWCMEVEFDYGDHTVEPTSAVPYLGPSPGAKPSIRADPFSTYAPGFEVRTRWLCRNILMFHRFPELDEGRRVLVHATRFGYADEHARRVARLESVESVGFRHDGSGYTARVLPALRLAYTPFDPQPNEFTPLVAADATALPGDASRRSQLVDLYGEGVPGLLYCDADTTLYWEPRAAPNSSNSGAVGYSGPHRPETFPIHRMPGSPSQRLLDLTGNGQLDLLVSSRDEVGRYQIGADRTWGRFVSLAGVPTELLAQTTQLVDLTGDGLADAVCIERDRVVVYRNLGSDGFGAGVAVDRPPDLPWSTHHRVDQVVRFADAFGSGGNDLIEITSGRVRVWPHLGFGRFAEAVELGTPPSFGADFDPNRLFLVDLDGSGTADIVYVHHDRIEMWINESGNGFAAEPLIVDLPWACTTPAQIGFADVLGTGTIAVTFTASDIGGLWYLDVCDGRKAHLLCTVENGFGATTQITYCSSTRFALADKRDGRPWLTQLPFPVQVVERVEVHDAFSGTRHVSRHTYHHGYYDGDDREFRGFARVDRFDADEFTDRPAPDNLATVVTQVPPVLTRTWYHTGALLGQTGMLGALAGLDGVHDGEFWREPGLTDDEYGRLLLVGREISEDLSADEERDATRALHGTPLREEIYAIDGTRNEPVPYTVRIHSAAVVTVQPRGAKRCGAYVAHERELVTYSYDRKLADPRVAHTATIKVDHFGNVLSSIAVGYGRRTDCEDEPLTEHDRATQRQLLMSLSENTLTGFETTNDDHHRLPLIAEQQVFELTGCTPTNGERFTFDELTVLAGSSERRLLRHDRTRYRSDDLTTILPLGTLESLALPGEHYQLALTDSHLTEIRRKLTEFEPDADIDELLGGNSGECAGYVADDDGWWIASGRIFFDSDVDLAEPANTAAAELHQAETNCFLPRVVTDAFGHAKTVEHDVFNLFVTSTTDSVGNTAVALYDYLVLQPRRIIDHNGNQATVAFDALGVVVATALAGKEGQGIGDSVDGIELHPRLADLDTFILDPVAAAPDLLGSATSRVLYDRRGVRSTGSPTFVATLSRATHSSAQDLSMIHITVSYLDGLGRVLQSKSLDAVGEGAKLGSVASNDLGDVPSAAQASGPAAAVHRWVGSGRTVYNNKGAVVRHYEPFFCATPRYERDRETTDEGVSTLAIYDPLGRVVASVNPDHTWTKAIIDPWRLETWDAGDTVGIAAPHEDEHVGSYICRLPVDDYLPTWASQQRAGSPAHQRAAAHAAVHAATPTVAYFDALGRTFMTVSRNRAAYTDRGRSDHLSDELIAQRVLLDVEGNVCETVDPLGRTTSRHHYDLVGRPLGVATMDASASWVLPDAAGSPLYAWDSLGIQSRIVYDELRRPVGTLQHELGGTELTVGRVRYGESALGALDRNLRGRVYQSCDQAGIATNERFDFQGNLLHTERRFAVSFSSTLDWSDAHPPTLDTSVAYASLTTFDALNRPVVSTSPDGSEIRYSYGQRGLLERLDVNLRRLTAQGEPHWTPIVTGITYDARGTHTEIAYGNGTATTYTFDPHTFELTRLTTAGDAVLLQDISYTYDPVGNIVQVRDDSRGHTFFHNHLVEPVSTYVYDSLSRLIEATGREHLGQAGTTFPQYASTDRDALGTFSERFEYDPVGNLRTVRHRGWTSPNAGGQRIYNYAEPSALEPEKFSNRLSEVRTGNRQERPRFGYDAHGNTTSMPHLPVISWHPGGQLRSTSQQRITDGSTPETTWYVYDAGGQRVRQVTTRHTAAGRVPTRAHERIYLGGFEVTRDYAGDGQTVELEREALNIEHGRQRIAIAERRTVGNDRGAPTFLRYQLTDHLGSSTLEMDGEGRVVSYEEFTAFGATTYQAVASETQTPKRYRYSGKELDAATGFYYFGARYYAPWLARWISPDPAGEVDGPNVYAFVGGNPVAFVDHRGACRSKATFKPTPSVGARPDTPRTAMIAVLMHPNFVANPGRKAESDKGSRIGRLLAAARQAPGAELQLAREDPETYAASAALGFVPLAGTALHVARYRQASEHVTAADGVANDSALHPAIRSLAEGVGGNLRGQKAGHAINSAVSATSDVGFALAVPTLGASLTLGAAASIVGVVAKLGRKAYEAVHFDDVAARNAFNNATTHAGRQATVGALVRQDPQIAYGLVQLVSEPLVEFIGTRFGASVDRLARHIPPSLASTTRNPQSLLLTIPRAARSHTELPPINLKSSGHPSSIGNGGRRVR